MKYRKSKIIQNVAYFQADIEAVVMGSDECKPILFYRGKEYELYHHVSRIRYHNDTLFIRYTNGQCDQFRYGKFSRITTDEVWPDIFAGEWLWILYFNRDDCENYSNLYNLTSHTSLFNNLIPYMLYCEDDVIIAYNNFKGELKRITTTTESIWEFPLSSLGDAPYAIGEIDKIRKILGIVHGRLWFYTDFGRLVSLNVETGGIVKVFSCQEDDEKRGFYFVVGLGQLYLHDDRNIYGIGSTMFTVIDTDKCSIIERYNTQESDSAGIGIYNGVFKPLLQGDYFTFIGQKPMDSYGCGWIGIFDYASRNLVWEYELLPQDDRKSTRTYLSPTDQLYMSGNRLYIKDSKKTLHIFERED